MCKCILDDVDKAGFDRRKFCQDIVALLKSDKLLVYDSSFQSFSCGIMNDASLNPLSFDSGTSISSNDPDSKGVAKNELQDEVVPDMISDEKSRFSSCDSKDNVDRSKRKATKIKSKSTATLPLDQLVADAAEGAAAFHVQIIFSIIADSFSFIMFFLSCW